MNATSETKNSDRLVQQLKTVLGAEHVSVDLQTRQFYSRDLSFLPFETALAVVRPEHLEELARAVAAVTAAGYAVVARGGGMSYTSGYTPERPDTVLIDMRRMNRILEINRDDMYVVVECGCTWKVLFEALQPLGLRTPYWGPLSGMFATIGGALSQNSLFHGSGTEGTVADSVLGLKVVLGDGSVLTTGSGAHKYSNAFWRHFGPDLTGLFTADTGAFGVKAVAVLRLQTLQRHTAYLSYKFDSLEAMLRSQLRIARLRIASECYGFDPYYNSGFEKQGITFEEGIAMIGKVARKGGLKALAGAAKIAVGGKRILKHVPYSLHMTFDGHTELVAAEHMDLGADICAQEGGTEMSNSIPQIFRANPFGSVRTILLGAEGEIWLPVHGFFPLSKAVPAAQATELFLERNRALMQQWGIKTSYLTCFAGSEFVIEPSFYWHDELGAFRLSLIEPEFAQQWKDIPANEARRHVALKLRDELRDLFDQSGALHLQIGKYYNYTELMNHETLPRILRGVKKMLDPEGLINPGALGLR